MKTALLIVMSLALASLPVQATNDYIVTIYQPLRSEDGMRAMGVPVVMSTGAFPEKVYQAIVGPYIPPQYTYHKVGNINAAFDAGILLTCEPGSSGKKFKVTLVFDFSKANPKEVNEELIHVLLDCIAKTEPRENVVLYSRMANAEKFPAIVKQIEARIPAEAPTKKKESKPK